jgi:hypothetical protein
VFSFLEEVGQCTGIELSLKELTTMKERFAGRVERAVENDEEFEGFLGEDLLMSAYRVKMRGRDNARGVNTDFIRPGRWGGGEEERNL